MTVLMEAKMNLSHLCLFENGKRLFTIKVLVLIEFPSRPLLFRNIFYEYAILSPTINFVVLIAVLYNLLWFINVNEQNIKKWASVISLLKEDETDQAIEEPDEIMHINRDSESKYDKSDRHETFELNCNFQMLPKELYQEN
ncbi:uncharacterized protein TNCV_1178161 [Trichonephila clavipes]|nr:uncharacterized protein TNCV_1178161 [Trichonephila clavipes]